MVHQVSTPHWQQTQATKRARSSKRRVGRPALPLLGPRGRAQRVLMRGMMAERAAHAGGQADLPQARGHAEALPTRLSPVNRVLRSAQVRTQR